MCINKIYDVCEIYEMKGPHSPGGKKQMEHYKKEYQKHLPKDKSVKILDVGCGFGMFLYMLKEMGYTNIEGVEIGKRQAEATRELGIKVTHISGNGLKQFLYQHKNTWDLITLNHVLEHFKKDDIIEHLIAIREALKDNGKIFVQVPNIALLSGAFYAFGEFTHEVAFLDRTLKEVLFAAGFRDIEIYGCDKISFKMQPKFLLWFIMRTIWIKILDFIYLLEKGQDKPGIISRALIAVANKNVSNI